MQGTVSGLVASYGYVVLFFLVGLESLGIPLPGETALVTAAAFAALGHLSIYGVVTTAVAAAVIGDNGGYWIGRKGGIALVRRYGRFIHLNEAHLERARHFFGRHGPPTVFIGRFIALLRTWTAVLAGAARMPYGRFMLYNALGAACWAGAVGALGYVFGRNLPRLEHYMGQASLAGILLVGWLAAFAGGGLLDVVLKLLIRRPRPPGAAAFLQHFSWSFPSGHAMASLIGYGMLAYVLTLLWIHRRSAQIAVVLGAALLIIAIGFSRLYLGVHYFSDVVGGYAAGVLWLSACISGLEVARGWRAGLPSVAPSQAPSCPVPRFNAIL